MCGGYLGNQPSPPSPVRQGGTLSSLGSETDCRVALGEGTQSTMHTKPTLGTHIHPFIELFLLCIVYMYTHHQHRDHCPFCVNSTECCVCENPRTLTVFRNAQNSPSGTTNREMVKFTEITHLPRSHVWCGNYLKGLTCIWMIVCIVLAATYLYDWITA